MGRGIAHVNAAKARGIKLLADAGLLSSSGRSAAAASLVVVLTSLVTGHPEWGLAGIVPLGVLACAQMVQAARQAQQASGDALASDVPTGDVLMGTAGYGVARFAAGQGIPPGALLGPVMSSAYVEFSAKSAKPGSMINLKNEGKALKDLLKARQSKVILVHGPPSAGKSTLVHSVLREMGLEAEARSHDLAPHDRLDAKALLDDIEPGPWAGAALKPGEDLLGRLELAVEARRGVPVIIVVDGAQSLFEPGNRMDDQLAAALEVISRGRRVKVILIAQDFAVPGTGGSWHGTADRVFVGGLHPEHFSELLRRLNPAFGFGLTDRTTTEPDRLYDVLQGNPRQAEMFCAAVGLPESRLNADDFVRQLALQQPGERGRRLASAVVDSLSQDQRRVAATIAACGIPVTIEHANDVLTERRNTLLERRKNAELTGKKDSQAEVTDGAWTRKLSADQVGVLASELVNWRVIDRAAGKGPDHYRLTAPEIYEALLRSKDLSAGLLWAAALVMIRYETPDERIKKPEDLRWHFAALDILLREAPLTTFDDPGGVLYELVQLIDAMKPVLRERNAEGLLLKYREAIQGKLRMPDSDHAEMVNSNALGCTYLARGRFRAARQAFDDALKHANGATSPDDRCKILIHLADLSRISGDTRRAKERYEEALACTVRDPAGVTERPGVLNLAAAETGLAECFRRWGCSTKAIDHGTKALNAARGQDPPVLVDIAVKLARWQSEQNPQKGAGRLLKEAEEAAGQDRALRVRCLAGRADLLLDAGHFRRAGWAARKALRRALRLRDTVTVLRASTTLATAHLMLGRIASPRLKLGHIAAARRAIDRAARCQHAGRSLDVMALRALIALRSDPDGEEARGLFAEVAEEAGQPDTNDFAAPYFEGTGDLRHARPRYCLTAGGGGRHTAVREVWPLPGLVTTPKRWMKILQARAAPGRLSPVMAVISGYRGVQLEPPSFLRPHQCLHPAADAHVAVERSQ